MNFDDILSGEVTETSVETEKDLEVIKQLENSIGFPFSEEQLKVLRKSGVPLSIISCAGAGKTTVLVSKILYLDLMHGVNPNRVLGITFNKEASESLKERYKKIRKGVGKSAVITPSFNTFHSLFYKMLRSIPKYGRYQVVNMSSYTYPLLKKVKYSSGESDNTKVLDDYMNLRGKLINEGHNELYWGLINGEIKTVSIDYMLEIDIENFVLVMSTYESLKEERRELDFEDMISILYQVMYDEEDATEGDRLSKTFREVYDYVFIDEYQDINYIQMKIIDKLLDDDMTNNLTVIGDADQCIYEFRGSNPSYIVDFIMNYKNAERLYLGLNYRCKGDVLYPIISSITKNSKRVEYDMGAFLEGGEVQEVVGDDAFVNKVSEEADENNDIILVRLKMQQKVLSDKLIENDVAVCINNSNSTIRNDIVYRDVMDVIHAIKFDDVEKILKVSYKLFPWIKRDVWKKIDEYGVGWMSEILDSGKYTIASDIRKDISKVRGYTKAKNMVAFAYKLLSTYYKKISKKGYVSMKDVEIIVRHMLATTYDLSLEDYLIRERRKEAILQDNFKNGTGLRIGTMHSVKGLEYNKVFLYGLNNDVIPNENRMTSMNPDEVKQYIEGERRLFYVAWTRAKDTLIYNYESMAKKSMFIDELNQK